MITVIKPGLSDSIQDLGRFGYQKYGVVTSGVMDAYSHRIANFLVGNEAHESTLEMSLLGPHLLFEEDTMISLCGGDLSPTVNGQSIPLWRPILIEKGTVLKLSAARLGCRGYLAVAGGFQVPLKMNSRSTYLKAEIGGFKGRVLKAGDTLKIGSVQPLPKTLFTERPLSKSQTTNWRVAEDLLPAFSNEYEIQVMRGRQFDLFDEESQHLFFKRTYTVGSQSDRMGYRLSGPTLTLKSPSELISEAVSFGSIQVPPDGQPILLAADRQTAGGYPKIGQVSTIDFTRIAQAKPGDRLTFKEISLEASQKRLMQQENNLRLLKAGIGLKFN